MGYKQKGYISILLLLVVAGATVLAGGFSAFQSQPADPTATKYVLVDPSQKLQRNTLELQNLEFIPAKCDPGYLLSGEPNILYAASPAPNQIAGSTDKIKLWYSDEHPLTLGMGTVSPMTTQPSDHVFFPQVGDTTQKDPFGFPFFPALFVSDITFDSTNTSGDATHNGIPFPPSDVYGSWKAANGNDPSQNGWNLPPGSDPFPSQPTIQHSTGKLENEYGAEIEWNISSLNLTQGHTYRVQFVVHDGDTNKAGGDLGVGCTTIRL